MSGPLVTGALADTDGGYEAALLTIARSPHSAVSSPCDHTDTASRPEAPGRSGGDCTQPARSARRAVYRSSRESAPLVQRSLVIVMAAVALDQVTKWWAESALDNGRVINVLPTLDFDLSYNSGFSFGTGSGFGPWIGLIVIAMCGFLGWLIVTAETPTRSHCGDDPRRRDQQPARPDLPCRRRRTQRRSRRLHRRHLVRRVQRRRHLRRVWRDAFGANEIWLSRQVNDEIDAVELIGDGTPQRFLTMTLPAE